MATRGIPGVVLLFRTWKVITTEWKVCLTMAITVLCCHPDLKLGNAAGLLPFRSIGVSEARCPVHRSLSSPCPPTSSYVETKDRPSCLRPAHYSVLICAPQCIIDPIHIYHTTDPCWGVIRCRYGKFPPSQSSPNNRSSSSFPAFNSLTFFTTHSNFFVVLSLPIPSSSGTRSYISA